jgi:hypothetical protein
MSMPEFKVYDLLLSHRLIEANVIDQSKEFNIFTGNDVKMAMRYSEVEMSQEKFK